MSDLHQDLEWRYATKKFDASKKLSEAQVNELINVLRLAPSSFGLQPWKFLIVKDPAVRKQLKGHAWNQSQVEEASHLIVLCVLKKLDDAYVKKFVQEIAKTRGVAVESLKGYEDIMLGFIKSRTAEELSNWMKRQLYIALGFLMADCAAKHIDSCPIEGFDPKKFDEILGLEAQGLESVVLCPVGYRASDDNYANLKKVRFGLKDVLIEK